MPSHSYLNTVLLRSEDVCFIFPFIHLFFLIPLPPMSFVHFFLTPKEKWTNIFVLFIDKNLSASRSNSYRPTNKCPGPAKTSLTWHTLTPRISRYGGEEGGHIPHYPIHILYAQTSPIEKTPMFQQTCESASENSQQTITCEINQLQTNETMTLKLATRNCFSHVGWSHVVIALGIG